MAREDYDMNWEIKDHIGILSKNSRSGWRRELTRTRWNGNPAKLEIRDWNEDYTKAGKGMTFTDDEMGTLKAILNNLEI